MGIGQWANILYDGEIVQSLEPARDTSFHRNADVQLIQDHIHGKYQANRRSQTLSDTHRHTPNTTNMQMSTIIIYNRIVFVLSVIPVRLSRPDCRLFSVRFVTLLGHCARALNALDWSPGYTRLPLNWSQQFHGMLHCPFCSLSKSNFPAHTQSNIAVPNGPSEFPSYI